MNGLTDGQLTENLDNNLLTELSNRPVYQLANDINDEFREFFSVINGMENNEWYLKYKNDAYNNIPVY